VYSYNFSKDNRYIKTLVYGVFLLETVQTALSGVDLYKWFATGFGNFETLLSLSLTYVDVPILGSVVSLIVQFFFAYRILVLSGKRSWWLCVIICLLSIVSAVGAFGLSIISYKLDHSNPTPFVTTWIIANMLCDMFITSTMLYHLRKTWVRDGNLSSHVFVSIVRVTIETNLVTTAVNIVTVVLFYTNPYDFFVCPAYIFGKLYSNTLMVSLNNRIAIRDNNEARGPVVDLHAMALFKSSVRTGSTTDIIVLEHEKPQDGRMNQPVAVAGVKEGVKITVTNDVV